MSILLSDARFTKDFASAELRRILIHSYITGEPSGFSDIEAALYKRWPKSADEVVRSAYRGSWTDSKWTNQIGVNLSGDYVVGTVKKASVRYSLVFPYRHEAEVVMFKRKCHSINHLAIVGKILQIGVSEAIELGRIKVDPYVNTADLRDVGGEHFQDLHKAGYVVAHGAFAMVTEAGMWYFTQFIERLIKLKNVHS